MKLIKKNNKQVPKLLNKLLFNNENCKKYGNTFISKYKTNENLCCQKINDVIDNKEAL